MIRALLFDLEGTIIDTEPIWNEADTQFLKKHGAIYDASTVLPLILGHGVVEGAQILKDYYGLPGTAEDLAAQRHQILIECFAKDISYTDNTFIEFFDAVARQYPRAIATALEHSYLKPVNKKLNLSAMFGKHVYSIEDIGFISKPNPDIFLHAAKKLDIKPEECLVFEDAPHGIEAARRAGMRCAALTLTVPRKHLTAADVVVNSYAELLRLAKAGKLF